MHATTFRYKILLIVSVSAITWLILLPGSFSVVISGVRQLFSVLARRESDNALEARDEPGDTRKAYGRRDLFHRQETCLQLPLCFCQPKSRQVLLHREIHFTLKQVSQTTGGQVYCLRNLRERNLFVPIAFEQHHDGLNSSISGLTNRRIKKLVLRKPVAFETNGGPGDLANRLLSK